MIWQAFGQSQKTCQQLFAEACATALRNCGAISGKHMLKEEPTDTTKLFF